MRVKADSGVKVKIADQGEFWQVFADCPSCTARIFVNVQPGPWSVPDEPVEAAETDGHLVDGFAKFEQRRAAGKIKHRAVTDMQTQLWCFRCEKGITVTVTAG